MLRRTKIVATLGPATDNPDVLEKLLLAGANVLRLNFSHGAPEDHLNRATLARELARKHDLPIAILGDLQGPKIRVARFADGPIQLKDGDAFTLDAQLGKMDGNQQTVGIDYADLPKDCNPGDRLLLDDGRVILKITDIEGSKIHTTVDVGGQLSNNKGINREGGGLTAPALTAKDREDIKLAVKIDVDYLAVSFPRSAEDMNLARQLFEEAGGNGFLVAKIERAETVNDLDCLDKLINASDVVMVARGDLGVEIGDAALVGVQKTIIRRARHANKGVITATQMMESMISSPMPTRAEVMDVANAVLDGTDAVMLSAETAAGKYPIETVKAMVRVIMGAEQNPDATRSKHRLYEEFDAIDESIAMAAMYTANHLEGIKAVICMTETGKTPLLMSRINSGLPIFAYTRSRKTESRVVLFRGVYSVGFESSDDMDYSKVNAAAVDSLKERKVVDDGDLVIITKGDYMNVHGGTNALKIVRVGDEIQ
ncbi:pyruvate kinase [Marinibactrum halimedae]|uniref:Pyruvate kinase n=1 Tax=Marinibactrum halimedae TaxID=1444977 RepID=A0AA37T8Q2_9GAMM|nr:pyruvate kinase [Marinibactrum halimedae]MCD9461149.1 pyruvate kinase [Marinibactrum halimedae]GLS26036.1 pyruvate kinase [Marinibactrum halimedae]